MALVLIFRSGFFAVSYEFPYQYRLPMKEKKKKKKKKKQRGGREVNT
jgi:predicted alpha/beta-hydrolase family hydrolase